MACCTCEKFFDSWQIFAYKTQPNYLRRQAFIDMAMSGVERLDHAERSRHPGRKPDGSNLCVYFFIHNGVTANQTIVPINIHLFMASMSIRSR